MKHLTIGGSTAARTLACPGWVEKSKNVPKRPAGFAAREGSMHHSIMEMCQAQDNAPKDHLGFIYKEDGHEHIFDNDALWLSNLAHAATETLLDKLDIDEIELEAFAQYTPGLVGSTTDLLGISKDRKTALVLDYKFGRVTVAAENNSQLLFCAMCAMRDPETRDLFKKVDRITLVIIQPQSNNITSVFTVEKFHIIEFSKLLDAAVEKIEQKYNIGHPGPHCEWCPASPYCKEKRFAVAEAMNLGARDRGELISASLIVEEVEDWLKSMKEEMYLSMKNGVFIPGWKIVNKKTKRTWIDEKAAEKALKKAKIAKKHIYETKMRTAPAMDKLLKKVKSKFDPTNLIETKDAGTTLAPESDSKPAVVATEIPDALKNIVKRGAAS